MKKYRKVKFICIITVIINIIANMFGCTSSKKNVDNKINEVNNIENPLFEVTFMDAGKADCILINIDDKSIMIDTGLNKTKYEVVSKLEDKKIEKLDYLILTHMDKDHIGGVDAILDNFEVGTVIQADYMKDSKQYNQYIESLEKNNITPVILKNNMEININNAEISIYPALKSEYSKSNDYSIIVGIKYHDYSFLFAGDAEEERLSEFISMNNQNYTVVKMPHHGRENILSEEFIKSTNPVYSIITCSDEDKPDKEIIDMLNEYNIKTFLTSNGEVVIKTDGKNISISQ